MKSWEKVGFKDSVIFAWIVSEHKDICLELLQLILPELKLTKISEVISEYTQKDSNDTHGVRFDIFTEDHEGRMYDIEMQVIDRHDLSKRIAYYQSNLVRRSLGVGHAYNAKADTYVIFICDFDYGGSGLPIYTTEMILRENHRPIDTGEHNIILNAKSKKLALVSKRLAIFLKYLESSEATDTFTQKIDKLVAELKKDTGKKDHYMEYEQEVEATKAYVREEVQREDHELLVKNMIKEGYSRKKIIHLMTRLAGLKEHEAMKIYDKLLVK